MPFKFKPENNRIPQQEEATGSGEELKQETLTANLHWLLPAKGLGGGQRWSRRELWDLQEYDPCLLLYERWAHTEKVEILWAQTREILSTEKTVAVSCEKKMVPFNAVVIGGN